MKRILVPIDFSKTSLQAADVAADIARKDGAPVVLLHVIEEAGEGSFNTTGEVSSGNSLDNIFTMKLIQKTKKQMDKLVEDDRFKGVKVTSMLRLGNPFHTIREIITEQQAELVVMGTSGKSRLEEVLVGSNTSRVIRYSKCPVLTVQKKPAVTNFKNIVYATSMSPDEEVFSRIVRRSQQLYNSTLHLVRINTPGDFQRDATVTSYMQKFAKKLQLKNFTLNIYNDFSTDEGIINFAATVDADLIAMATHGRQGISHLLTGSVAEEVAGKSTTPVLTFVVKR